MRRGYNDQMTANFLIQVVALLIDWTRGATSPTMVFLRGSRFSRHCQRGIHGPRRPSTQTRQGQQQRTVSWTNSSRSCLRGHPTMKSLFGALTNLWDLKHARISVASGWPLIQRQGRARPLSIINFCFLYSDWLKILLQPIGDSFVIRDVGWCLS